MTHETTSHTVPGWRCVNCDVMIQPKGEKKAAVTWRRPRGGGKPIGFCQACGKPAHKTT